MKDIITYPKKGYAPWEPVELKKDTLSAIRDNIRNRKFAIQIVHGKVYAVDLSKGESITDSVYTICKEELPPNVRANSETSHITLVNSNIVDMYGTEKVTNFIKTRWFYDAIVESVVESPSNIKDIPPGSDRMQCSVFDGLAVGKIKSTISEDWSRFSRCYVVEISHDVLDGFVESFNKHFGANIKPMCHITFAINPRSLW